MVGATGRGSHSPLNLRDENESIVVNSQIPSEDDIINALNRTGFILEHQVAQVLRAAGFMADTNYAYEDAESGKSRELDVYAEDATMIASGDLAVFLHVELLIECKNNVDPFIVLGDRGVEGRQLRDALDALHLSVDPPTYLGYANGFQYSLLGEFRAETSLRLPIESRFVANQLVRMDRHGGKWGASNSSIYDSILYPLAKALDHRRGFVRAVEGKEYNALPGTPEIVYYFPVLVVMGPLFIVDMTDGSARVERADSARLQRTFDSASLKSNFWVDIVTFEYFPRYVQEFVSGTMSTIEEVTKEHLIIFDPEWLQGELGQPPSEEAQQRLLEWRNSMNDGSDL
jgi:hypothetical protein